MLASFEAARLRHPAAIKMLYVQERRGCYMGVDRATLVPSAVASLVGGNPALRRSMTSLRIDKCYFPALQPVVAPVAACTALTELYLGAIVHGTRLSIPPDLLAPPSALPLLERLTLEEGCDNEVPPTATPLTAWPALPDAPRLRSLR